MKKLLIVLIILILVFGAISAWAVKVYARPLEVPDLKVVVVPEESGVFVKSGDEGFKEVIAETDLKVGDTVRTDETGLARIVLFDANEVSLDKNSEVVIEESFIDEETPFLTKIKLNLKKGQIWNRLLEFLHPDAYFEVESGGVVATVRGTIFDMSNIDGEVNVSVLENSVALTAAGETEVAQILKSGEEFSANLQLLKNLREAKILQISEDARASEWFKNNFSRDEKFREFIKEKKNAILKQVGPLPGSRFYPAKLLGERVASLLTFDKTARAEKERNFSARKFLAARLLLAQGEKIKAVSIIKSISDPRGIVPLARRLDYYDRDFLKEEVQKLKNGLGGDEIKSYFDNVLLPRQLEFINQKLELSPVTLPKTEEILIKPLELDLQNTNSAPTNTNTVVTPPVQVAPTAISLSVAATPSAIAPQGNSKLTVTLTMSDGSTRDVTDETTWTVSLAVTGAPMGSISGGIFYSNGMTGNVSVTGTYDAGGGKILQGSTSVQVTFYVK